MPQSLNLTKSSPSLGKFLEINLGGRFYGEERINEQVLYGLRFPKQPIKERLENACDEFFNSNGLRPTMPAKTDFGIKGSPQILSKHYFGESYPSDHHEVSVLKYEDNCISFILTPWQFMSVKYTKP